MSLLFSVVIPTYQRPGDLKRCLDQLAPGAQTLPFEQYEVIVTDDEGEGSATQELMDQQYSWAQWVTGPGKGPAANRNNGASHAQGEWLVFTDDDCIPQERWLEAYLLVLKNQSEMRVLEGATLPERPRESLAWQAPINRSGGRLWSCNLAVEANFWETLQGFDTDYPFALEDLDFKTRILKSDVEWTFVEDAVVIHPWREGTARELFRRQMRELKGWRVYARKHPDAIRKFSIGYLLSGLTQIRKDFQSIEGKKEGGFTYGAFWLGRLIKIIAIVLMSYTK